MPSYVDDRAKFTFKHCARGLVYFCWWFFKWEVVLGKKNSFCCHLIPDSVHASTVTSDYKPQVILREKLLEKKANVWE